MYMYMEWIDGCYVVVIVIVIGTNIVMLDIDAVFSIDYSILVAHIHHHVLIHCTDRYV